MATPKTDSEVAANPASASAPESPGPESKASNGKDSFVLPVVHLQVPEVAVNLGFWGALVAAAAVGAVELPLAALIGAGVLVARHHHSH